VTTVSVCLSVCPRASLELHSRTSPFLRMSPVAVARSSSGGVAIRYIGPVFTARCYASAVLAMALCPSVCPSVRQSVSPSQVGVLLKRLNVGSHKQYHTIAQGL